MKTKYTFWELLNNYKIEIPKIQRDYAQGRANSSIIKIVDKFLSDIKISIINSKELNLDFVYGRVDDKILIPLDGQQRLTTLFLIHWYLALKEDRLTENVKNTLLQFTYETRVSSEDFCKNLVAENIDYSLINGEISNVITDSKWYFLSWELDPTVSAMLNMLDKIHHKFKDIEVPLFEKLEEEINITFQFLPLEQFKLTDELYIKMNARGKPLTEFENFKANFSNYLTKIENKSKLDNEWLDIFWNLEKNRNPEIVTENIDEKFFNFFKNITLNFYTETNEVDRFFVDNYKLFDTYSEVYRENKYVHQIINVLDGLISFNDNENIFENFLSSSVNYWERLRFYSLSHFFIKYGAINEDNEGLLNNWLRVSKNLINNTLIQSAANYKDAIQSINELSDNISDIYTFASSSSDTIKFFSKLQREEEGLKSTLILEDVKWEELFKEIEQHSYFDGQIGFILKYSKKDDNSFDKALFKNYSEKLTKLFSSELRENNDFLFERALLTKGDYLPQVGNSENYTFCIFEEALRTKLDNWRKVFNDDEDTLILKELLDNISNANIFNELKEVIKNHNVTDWRKLIIENPENISYCQHRQIRWYSDDVVYLLSKKQMNSHHREIYSWDLFQRKFNQIDFQPFSDKSWYRQSTSWDKPCIVLSSFHYDENRFAIEIIYDKDGIFSLIFTDWDSNEFPNEVEEILKILGFENNRISLSEEETVDKINDICNKLKEIKQE